MQPHLFVTTALAFVLACGGQVTQPDPSGDAGSDAPSSPDTSNPTQCHGYCPQPNGSACASDCDCDNKCLFGTDTPPVCADPIVPAIACTSATECPSGQSCSAFGTCEGSPCTTSNECPSKQQCIASACAVVGCI
jgi:hypothetical protein